MADNHPAPSPTASDDTHGSADQTNGFGILVPFAKLLGIHVVEQDREHALLRVHNRPELLNSWGVANGGVVMTLLDLAMGCASTSWVFFIINICHWAASLYPDRAQREVWGENPDARV